MLKNKDRKLFIILSESKLGIHSKADYENYLVFDLVVVPEIKHDKKKDTYFPYVNLEKNKKFQGIKEAYESNKSQYSDVIFLLGYDADENGELMAQAIREQLILLNIVEESKIYRTPLTEHGYVAIAPFLNINKYCRFLYLQKKFISRSQDRGLIKAGFRKILSLRYLLRASKKKQKRLNLEVEDKNDYVNKNGNSTYTYLFSRSNV